MKDKLNSPQKQLSSHIQSFYSDSFILSDKNFLTKDSLINIYSQDDNVQITSSSFEPHWPVFTLAIGVFDIIMLLILYIVQQDMATSSETWIKMGCKYVPCMKPLYSKSEQDLFNSELKSRCQSFLFPYQFFRFFTPIFLHGDVTHLLSNLIYQALAGTLLEGKYSKKTLAISYLLFGCSANIMSSLCNQKTISMGASGAVYGLLLFCIIDNTLRVFTIINIQDKIIQVFIAFLIIPYIILSVFYSVDSSGHADHAAHIGGAVMGVLVALFLCDMPGFIKNRIPNGEKNIQLIALVLIVGYFTIALLIFYLFIPVHLK